ncbi:MAG: chromosome segregation protein ScpA [Acidobacteria bacterium]|nr:chromosome segregation protein ScpA [Acidobacteriota bacterium]
MPPDEEPEESQDGERQSGPLDVQLPVYHGPLDLLLDLVRKHKLDIFDLPIAQITEQYLGYLKTAEKLNIDLGGDFIFMASTLIHIKSKMLLPKDPTIPEEEQEDPRDELVRQLLDHEKFVQAAQMLRQKREIEENVWSNPPVESFEDEEEPGLSVNVFDLVSTFEKVLQRFKSRPTYNVAEEEVSVASRIDFLKNVLFSLDEAVRLEEVFEKQPSVRALVATFLAVLEMVRMQAIVLVQEQAFGSIVIRKHKMFDTVFSGATPMSAADAEYSD